MARTAGPSIRSAQLSRIRLEWRCKIAFKIHQARRLRGALFPDPLAKRLVDSRLPAPATGLEVINHILRQTDSG